jgi:stress-induced morphogen
MKRLPNFIANLRDRLVKELGGEVEVDPSDDGRSYTLWVFSEKFTAQTHLQRQDLVWSIVDQELDREESLKITLIMTFAPGEVDEFVDSLGTKK